MIVQRCKLGRLEESWKTAKKHQRHTRLGAVEKSAVAKHALLLIHEIDRKNAKVIDFASGVSQRGIKEKFHVEAASRERQLMNKDKGLKLENVWLNSL